jgi:hypothetical protein
LRAYNDGVSIATIRSGRSALAVTAVVVLALGAVSAGSARDLESQARTPRGVELRGNASCDSVIDQRQAPDFSTVLFNRVGMWPPSFVLQMVNNRYLHPFHYWGKQGVEVKAGRGPVDLIVPAAWRNRASLVYGDSSGSDGASMVRIKGCSAADASAPWLAYAGGFFARKPVCLPLLVRAGTQSSVVSLSLGTRCPSG